MIGYKVKFILAYKTSGEILCLLINPNFTIEFSDFKKFELMKNLTAINYFQKMNANNNCLLLK
jgi:hypothetical protein